MKEYLKFPSEALKITTEKLGQVFKAIEHDSALPIHIEAKGKAKKSSEFRKILLTGVTGHLGPYLLQQFCQHESLTHIFCLVRAPSPEKAEERVVNKLKAANILDKTDLAKVCYVLGDVAQNRLGLDTAIYSYLANNTDAVVNNAVHSNHVRSYPLLEGSNKDPTKCQLRAVNVTGVKNVLEFPSTGTTKHVLHSSTIALVNRLDSTDGRLIEELPEEDNLGDGIHWGYACSKFVAEKLCRTAMDQRGIPVTVIRYPLICGDSTTGLTAEMDNFSCSVLSMWSCGLFPCIPNNWGHSIIPVDTCALITKDLFFNDEAATGVYNLYPSFPATVEDFYERAFRNGITPARKSTYDEYFNRIINDDDRSNLSFMACKSIYSKRRGIKELFHSCPGMRLAWYDTAKLSGISPKLEKYVPGYLEKIPSTQHCLQNMFDFYKNAGRLPELGINTRPLLKEAGLTGFLQAMRPFIVKLLKLKK